MNSYKIDAKGDGEPIDDALVVAYFLSRMDMNGVRELGYKNFSSAFKELGRILDRKPATIKNMRDEFDPYFNNPRAGWYQRPLRKSRKRIYDQYQAVSDSELISTVKEIINRHKYSNRSHDEKREEDNDMKRVNVHKRIIISSDSMREIRRKR